MPTVITMPAFSTTMETGKLIKWLVNEGDMVKSGQALAEVETDKAVADIEAPTDGKLAKIYITDPDTDIPVNEKMALIIGENEEVDTSREEISEESSSSGSPDNNDIIDTQTPVNREDIKTSPGARRAADQAGIKIERVPGTGPKGRITKKDVLQYIEGSAHGPGSTAPDNNTDTINMKENSSLPDSVPVSPMRSAIARRLTESKQSIPHFYIETDINLDRLISERDEINTPGNNRPSLNTLFIKSAALALKESPGINTYWDDENITRRSSINIGIAVGIDEGLVVPVIENADVKDITQLNDESRELIKLARDKKLPQSRIGNASITISNLGMFKINRFYAIINPPESCILALGAINRKPVVINDGIHIASIMTCSMSADHRIIDGLTAARFLNSLKYILENPADWIQP